MRVSATISNADANGNIGSLVVSYPASTLSIPDIAGDSEVWVALRGFASAGSDAWDNLSIKAQGISDSLPAAPSALAVAPAPGCDLALTWVDNSNIEDGYVVSRSGSEVGPYTDIATLPPDTTNYLDSSITSPGRFFYKVRAINSLGSSASAGPAEGVSFQSRYRWKSVAIGGGGYVTSIYVHPLEPNLVYLRTDVGGFYRWDAANTRWIPITDSFTIDQFDYYGGEAMALDPQNPNVVYIAGGTSLHIGAVFKSTDRGTTWTKLPLNGISMHGNGSYKAIGERMVVSPHDSNVILFGTRSSGLQRSLDGGTTWSKMTSLPDSAWVAGSGITAVLFDLQTPGLVYAGINGNGIWQSTDNGTTWTQMVGAPTDPGRMALGKSGALLVTGAAGVSRYAAGAWSTTAPGGSSVGFRAISVNPANRDDVIVADSSSASTGPKTYRSADGGLTWTEFTRPKVNTVPWYDSFRRNNPALASMEFDPAVPGRVWLSDWYGVWHTDNINAATPSFTNTIQGLEENVVFTLCSPATGSVPLLSGVADNDGYRHTSLDSYPTSRFTGSQDTHSLAAFAGNSSRIVRSNGRNAPFNVSVSNDGGATWTNTAWSTTLSAVHAEQVAFSANDPNNIVAITDSSLADGGVPRVSIDGGATWQVVTGLPAGPSGAFSTSFPLAPDPQLADTFYYHDTASGTVYRSTDKGLTFAQVNSGTPLPSASNAACLRSRPDVAGDLWACLNTSGLYRSTDGGATFAAVPGVSRALRVAFGKAAPGTMVPALYLYGTVSGYSVGVFRSIDLGQTWTEITDPSEAMGDGVAALEASPQEYGLVFVGSSGRGIFYGRPLPNVNVLASAVPAAELGNVPGTFTIMRDGDATTALPLPLTFGGTATSGADYQAPSSSATIAASATTTGIAITPLSDSLAEGTETVTLSVVPSVDYLAGLTARLQILDAPFDAWRAQWFSAAELNDPSISGETADPNQNGLSNLLEYALDGAPKGGSAATPPLIGQSNGHLTLSFTRDASDADITYTVQATDDLITWTDLASSTGGAAMAPMVAGAAVSETGSGNGKAITVVDAIAMSDPAHPRRFLRLRVSH